MTLPSLDMPHWARFAVAGTRQGLGGLPHITDREIYATLQTGGFNVAASERRLADENRMREADEWRIRDQRIRDEQVASGDFSNSIQES